MADNKEILVCPACGAIMKKVLDDASGCYVDICTEGCGGLFFDNRELEKFDEAHEDASAIFKELEGKTFPERKDGNVRTCPICNVPMVKQGAANGEITIDVCNTCGAKFLDQGELQKIREYKESHKTDRSFETAYAALETMTLEAIMGHSGKEIKNSPRRQFFEDLVKKMLY